MWAATSITLMMPPVARTLTLIVVMIGTVWVSACASASAVRGRPSPFPGAPTPDWTASASAPLASVEIRNVLDTALALRGVPYRFGGMDPVTGVDCSGLVRYVFLQHRVDLPRTAAELFHTGIEVDRRRVEPGDLVFFTTVEPGPSHVGIALDDQSFLHAPGTGSVVRVERFRTPYWERRMLGVRRVAIGMR
jgi:cell wall-associated NlpC family hydrolase